MAAEGPRELQTAFHSQGIRQLDCKKARQTSATTWVFGDDADWGPPETKTHTWTGSDSQRVASLRAWALARAWGPRVAPSQ